MKHSILGPRIANDRRLSLPFLTRGGYFDVGECTFTAQI
jgi:hypothetical protein